MIRKASASSRILIVSSVLVDQTRARIDRLLEVADFARLTRQPDLLTQTLAALNALPLSPTDEIAAQYFTALKSLSTGDAAHASLVLDSLSERGPLRYRGRALLTLAGMEEKARNYDLALRHLQRAARYASMAQDSPLACQVINDIAVSNSRLGDGRGALYLLERGQPLVDHIGRCHPATAALYANTLAVELQGAGRVYEARHVVRKAFRSPAATLFPVLAETASEIECAMVERSRSRVFVRRKADVLSIAEWAEKRERAVSIGALEWKLRLIIRLVRDQHVTTETLSSIWDLLSSPVADERV